MTAPALTPIQFDAPLANPSPGGLYPLTQWTEVTGPSRFLISGVEVRVHNYGGGDAFGVWGAGWCGDPGDERKDAPGPTRQGAQQRRKWVPDVKVIADQLIEDFCEGGDDVRGSWTYSARCSHATKRRSSMVTSSPRMTG